LVEKIMLYNSLQEVDMKKTCLVFLIIFVFLGCTFLALLQPIGDYLVVQDKLQQTDLIAAVSGPEYRIVYAAELYTRGLGKSLFFTGGYSEENNRVEAAWSKTVAMHNGVPEEAITIDETAVLSTHDEAVLLKNYIDAHADSIKSVTVVTDPYHSRRARWIYQKVLGNGINVIVAPVPRTRTDFPKYWWTTAKSRELVYEEYVKLVFYYFRYEASSGKFREWLSKFDKY
jgi:uncharacterized SAM-binding protein YcdF (DUF218 family)